MQIVSAVTHIQKEISDIKENELSHVEGEKKRAKVDAAREQLQLLECKICRKAPTPPVILVTCCKQVLGCETCFQSYIEKQKCCPLCHDDISGSTAISVQGLDEPFALLRWDIQS